MLEVERPERPPQFSRHSNYRELLQCSPQSSIYTNTWWLDVVAPDSYEIVEVSQNGQLLAAWPIAFERHDGARHARMPLLTQKLGILFGNIGGVSAEVQSKCQKIGAELIERMGKFATFHQNFHENYTDWLPFHWQGYAQTTRYTYVLEGLSDHDSLWNNMRANHRRDIRRAERLGIRVEAEMNFSEFIHLNRKTFTRQGMDVPYNDQFLGLLDKAIQQNAHRAIFAGRDSQKRVHAAVYVAWDNGTAYYLMGGTEPQLRGSGAQLLALWEAIKFASSVARRFDFEGSMLRQVERVFRGFGAKQLPYFSITKLPASPSSLRGYVRQSIHSRARRLRQVLMGRQEQNT